MADQRDTTQIAAHRAAPAAEAAPEAAEALAGEPLDYRLDQQIGFLLRRAHQHASEVFQAKIGDRNLTPPKFSVLVTLLEQREIAQTPTGGLVARDPAPVLGVVPRLPQRGLVGGGPGTEDERGSG